MRLNNAYERARRLAAACLTLHAERNLRLLQNSPISYEGPERPPTPLAVLEMRATYEIMLHTIVPALLAEADKENTTMMTRKLDFREEHIVLVAKWWADQLRSKVASPSVERTGDAHLGMAERIRLRLSPSEEKIAAFEQKLAELLRTSECPGPWEQRTAETWGVMGTRTVHLVVDYHAAGLLLAACRFAGISDMSFPWKTSMHMGYDRAVVQKDGGKPFYLYGEAPAEQEQAP